MIKMDSLFPAISLPLIIALFIFFSACTLDSKDSAPIHVPIDIMAVPDAVPRYEKRTRAGNPVEYEILGKKYKVLAESKGYQQKGIASWYGTKFHGRTTSNGEIYNMYAMTAAHKTLPIPSYVRVTHLKNLRSVVVRVNDRGPFHENRIIDLSYAAAVKLGIQKTGTGFVEVTALEAETPEKRADKFQQKQGTTFYLQIGAFSSLQNARQLQNKLADTQINNSRILLTESKLDKLYKVQVGPFNTAQQANQSNKKLIQLGVTDITFVSQKASWNSQ